MRKKGFKAAKFIASFLIALIITLPFYTANVYAGISSFKVENGDGVKGFAKQNDYLVFELIAHIGGDADGITPEQVYLGPNNARKYGFTCEKTNPADAASIDYTCIKRVPGSGTSLFTAFPSLSPSPATDTYIPYIVTLVEDDNITIEEASSGVIYLEEEGPTLTFSILEPKSTGDVTFSYTIYDTANSATAGKCSGIKEIKFFQDDFSGNILNEVVIGTNEDDCGFSGSAASTYTSEGVKRVCAKAYDNVGLNNSENMDLYCKNVTIDTTAPTLISNSFKIVDSRNEPISYYSLSMDASATVSVNISAQDANEDNDLLLSSVVADLSQLNPALGSTTGSCLVTNPTDHPEITTCTWNVNLALGSGGDKQITFSFSDNIGNSGTSPLTWTFTEDITAPSVDSIVTNYTVGTESYATSSTNFIATFTESGSGFNAGDVTLLLDGHSAGGATECSANICRWKGVAVSGSTGNTITASVSGHDKANNLISNPTTVFNVEVDITPPEIIEVDGNTVRDGGDITQNVEFPTSTDVLTFTVGVTEDTTPIIYGDFSLISTDANLHTGACTEDAATGQWECDIEVTNLFSPYTEGQVEFLIVDSAGNAVGVSKDVTVYQADANTQYPNFVEVVGTSIGGATKITDFDPPKINRRVAYEIGMPLFIPLTLVPISSTVEVSIIDKQIEGCSATGGTIPNTDLDLSESNFDSLGFDFLSGTPYLFNEDTNNPQIVVEINGVEDELLEAEAVNVSCTLSLTVRSGNTVYLNPEIENIVAYVPLFDVFPTLNDAIQDKIDSTMSEIDSLQGKIDQAVNWNNLAGWGCTLITLMSQINSAMRSVATTVAGVLCVIDVFFLGTSIPITSEINAPVCGAAATVSTWTDTYLHLFGYPAPFTLLCMAYSCALADPSFWVNLGLSLADVLASERIREKFTEEEPELLDADASKEEIDRSFEQFSRGSPVPPTATPSVPTGDIPQLEENLVDANKAYTLAHNIWVTDGEPQSGDHYGNVIKTHNDIVAARTALRTASPPSRWDSFVSFAEGLAGGNQPPSDQFILDPYKSIYYADATLCLPGRIFNLKKAKQINCLKAQCYENSADAGVPTNFCDDAYEKRYCLYVESASHKLYGSAYFERLLPSVWDYITSDIVDFLSAICERFGGVLEKASCGTACASAAVNVGCRLPIVLRSLNFAQNLGSILDSFQIGPIERQMVEDVDYCEGLELE